MRRNKKLWGSPKIRVQRFVPQEYCAICDYQGLLVPSLFKGEGAFYIDYDGDGIYSWSPPEQISGNQTIFPSANTATKIIDGNEYIVVKEVLTPNGAFFKYGEDPVGHPEKGIEMIVLKAYVANGDGSLNENSHVVYGVTPGTPFRDRLNS